MSEVVLFTDTFVHLLVAVAAMQTGEGAGGREGAAVSSLALLTISAGGSWRTAAGEGPDTETSVLTRRLTGGLLAGGPGVAWLTGADTWADTGAVGATALATQGQLTQLAPPAGLSEAAQSYTLDISFWSFCPGPISHF